MSRKYKYKYNIDIEFDVIREECNVGSYEVSYRGSKHNRDLIVLSDSKIRIKLRRNHSYPIDSILSNHKNSVYEQVQKALIVYYSIARSFPIIKKVKIVNEKTNKSDELANGIVMPKFNSNDGNGKKYLNAKRAIIVFEDNEKAKAIRKSLTFWITGMGSVDKYMRFDKLWRSFDRLMLYNGNTKCERDGIEIMESLIRNNADVFKESVSFCKTMTYDIRLFAWKQMLSQYKGKIYVVMKKYSDSVIMNIFKRVVEDCKFTSNKKGELTGVDRHINLNIKTSNDIELVCIVLLRYTYYKRCKMFHAEFPDSSFKLCATSEDDEIDALSGLMEVAIKELLENNDLLR